ncbi:MAG: SDR family NAD(P)-dependent oxidoreductase, partial [Bacteriovoracaceae bacterium]|nr:SDR family NAD(P)-dependent oxidoreductase [Bacteriovoracaceae bacterium]
MFNFNDQIVIVTGGTRGIGSGISTSFLNTGATVIATYQGNHAKAEEFKLKLGALSEKLILKQCDVRDEQAI